MSRHLCLLCFSFPNLCLHLVETFNFEGHFGVTTENYLAVLGDELENRRALNLI